ncbi:malonyl-coenzyme A:anthocyanin 3-O-glucoside-6''-O-malonyltransferase-like protein [Carex littledalei]|uniref:Malonyl-coenzyme A:anthocyanin 3-O-glucoside-6''-O-malonyltransferase-like protein n=1 Tax=Carex littledalei TaxID=544730 RepID=A0A833RGR3_9POAL|nr:malonyl-coenzyme A:anthocyanin 3-O-glucoside-6''-O-malonyltransferase-like protein [Carex littledalei]
MKTLLLYPSTTVSSSFFYSFKSSLALTLPYFHLLAGDLTYLPVFDDVAIVCSDDSGVTVIEAESDLDICRLAGDPTHDVESFFQLMPNTSHEEMPMPILTVQYTKFSGGGVAVGISTHHTAMDAWGLWQFIDIWAKMSRDGIVPSGVAPIHGRAVIVYLCKEETKKERLIAFSPNQPKARSNRLQVYRADFGWGIPGLEALVSLSSDGEVVMSAGKEKDSVQITVGLKEDMEAFIHAFEGGLNSLKQ